MKKLLLISIIVTVQLSIFAVSSAQTFTEIDLNTEGSSYCRDFTELNGKLYIRVDNSFNSSTNGLWVSDGTFAGSHLVSNVCPNFYEDVYHLTPLNSNKLIFCGQEEEHDYTYNSELWVSDGTGSGTFMLKDINKGSGSSNPQYFTELNGHIYFSALDTSVGTELWRTDGTPNGTTLVKDIDNTYYGLDHASSYPQNLTVFKGKLFFSASSPLNGYELFSSDGTPGGTQLFIDLAAGQNNGSDPTSLIVFNDKLYFVADDYVHGQEIWSTDGTVPGTSMLKDITYPGGHGPDNLTVVDDQLFFSANDGVVGKELWVTDGTPNGTHLVKDIYNESNYSSQLSLFTPFNGKLFFFATDTLHGQEPWVSDGTEQGTYMVKDIKPGLGSCQTDVIIPYHNKVYFNAQATDNHAQLYESNGTDAGTFIIHPTGSTYTNPTPYENFYAGTALNSIFMTAEFTTDGYKLWRFQDPQSGIENIGINENNFPIYPNPANDELQIVSSRLQIGDEIRIIDVTGRILMREIISSITQDPKLETQTLLNGIYFVLLKSGDNIATTKLVIQH